MPMSTSTDVDPVFDAFRLWDEMGFPVEETQRILKERGTGINPAAFACDALGAGWLEEKVERTLRAVSPDLDWQEFRYRLAALWTVTGKLPDPECWSVMKRRVVDGKTVAA